MKLLSIKLFNVSLLFFCYEQSKPFQYTFKLKLALLNLPRKTELSVARNEYGKQANTR